MEPSSPRSRQSSFGTDACERFEPNPFKIAILLQKESCKHCGRLWTEHEGVIKEDIFEGYLQAMRKAADAWQRETKGEEWFFDGYGDEPQKGDDDHFRMMSPTSLANVNAQSEGAREVPGSAKVYSFIDFKECNVPSRSPEHPCDESSRLCESSDDLRLALQAAQDEVISLRHRCEALQARQMSCALLDAQRLCRDLAHDGPPETSPEAARPTVGLRDLEELQQSCALAIARLKQEELPIPKIQEEPRWSHFPAESSAPTPSSPRFLPKRIHGAAVLIPLAPEIYRVENRLQASTRGLAYRRSKCPTDVDASFIAPWGSTVTGRDEGDWIQCEARVSFWAPWAEVPQDPETEDSLGDMAQRYKDTVRRKFGDFVSHLNSMP